MLTAILQGTPRWVWILLVALIVIGIRQSFPRRRTLRSATIIPVAMIVLSFYGVISVFSQLAALTAWVGGVAAALLLSHAAGAWCDIRWSETDQRLLVPGSMVPLAVMLGLFFVKFGVGITLAMHHGIASDTLFAVLVSFAYGALSGVFLSRGVAMWKVGRQGLQLSMAA